LHRIVCCSCLAFYTEVFLFCFLRNQETSQSPKRTNERRGNREARERERETRTPRLATSRRATNDEKPSIADRSSVLCGREGKGARNGQRNTTKALGVVRRHLGKQTRTPRSGSLRGEPERRARNRAPTGVEGGGHSGTMCFSFRCHVFSSECHPLSIARDSENKKPTEKRKDRLTDPTSNKSPHATTRFHLCLVERLRGASETWGFLTGFGPAAVRRKSCAGFGQHKQSESIQTGERETVCACERRSRSSPFSLTTENSRSPASRTGNRVASPAHTNRHRRARLR